MRDKKDEERRKIREEKARLARRAAIQVGPRLCAVPGAAAVPQPVLCISGGFPWN